MARTSSQKSKSGDGEPPKHDGESGTPTSSDQQRPQHVLTASESIQCSDECGCGVCPDQGLTPARVGVEWNKSSREEQQDEEDGIQWRPERLLALGDRRNEQSDPNEAGSGKDRDKAKANRGSHSAGEPEAEAIPCRHQGQYNARTPSAATVPTRGAERGTGSDRTRSMKPELRSPKNPTAVPMEPKRTPDTTRPGTSCCT